jgi:alpha-soluble NSF attachment protein
MEKGDMLMREAEKKLKGGFLSNLMGAGSRYEDAADLYIKAGNAFKLAKNWEAGAEAFRKAAGCYMHAQSAHEAATAYINAANCIKKANPRESIDLLQQAVEVYTDGGRFSMAAKIQKDIAEMLEAEMDFENAMTAYQLAADYYEGENAKSAARGCLLKVATFAAESGDYSKAIEIFERAGTEAVDDRLLKYGAKEHFFKAGLCHLAAADIVSARRALEKYCDICPSFDREREYKLLDDITNACENYDVESFTNAVVDFDSMTKLDKWKTNILLKIKSTIKEGEEGEDNLQ